MQGKHESKWGRSHGFTLLELLIVVAIIGLLAAILFPVFARVRENARRGRCQSNLKQIGLGIQMYTQDYDDRYPQASYKDTSYSGVDNPPPGGWVSDYSRGLQQVAWHNLIEPYTKNSQIFICPSTPKLTVKNGIKNLAEGQVGINLALIQRRNSWNDAAPNSLSRVVSPVGTYAVFDCGTNILNPGEAVTPSGENGYLPGAGPYAGSLASSQAYKQNDFQNGRHFGGVNMLFADGHVKWLKSELVVAEARKYTTDHFVADHHPVQKTAWDPWFDNQ
jgi:prepilin-type N-terminal cleavage/methylation domain-containing protein/prepilin-type processing-associated H-X9-DG protein